MKNNKLNFQLIMFLSLSTFLLSTNLYSQQNNITTRLAQSLANETIIQLKKNNAPTNAKITIVNFNYDNGFSDSLRTKLGIEIAQQLEHQLQKLIQDKKLSYIILTSKKQTENLMNNTFTGPPAGVNEMDYWKTILGNLTPDYYIIGKFCIENNYSLIKTFQVKMQATIHNQNLKEIAIPDINTLVEDKIEKILLLNYQKSENINQLADYIALQIKFQTKIKNIKLSNLTYSDSKLPSSFSNRLAAELEQKLIKTGNFIVERNAVRGLFDRIDQTTYILSGNYWEDNENIKINVVLTNSENNIQTSSVECYFPIAEIKKLNLEYKPVNTEKIVENQIQINTDIIKNNFEINVWTNKGNDNVVFSEGEEMSLFIISNTACYVRFIYILSTGEPVLLLDNFQITQDKVGKAIEVSPKFECAAPFGAETLILNAQKDIFPALHFNEIDGYKFITEDLATILKFNRRGFKEKKAAAEKIIYFTTIKQ